MKRVSLTRIAAFSPFPEYLQCNGCDVARHLSAFGIGAERLRSEESLVPLRLACEFIQRVSDREGIDRFGLEVGSRARIRDTGMFGRILSQSVTLNDLLQRVIRWIPSVDSGARVWLEPSAQHPGSVRFCLRHEVDVGRAQIDAYGLLIFVDAVRMAAGPEWRPRFASLDAAAGDASRYEALSEAKMNRATDQVTFEIPRHLLGRRVARTELATQSISPEALAKGAPSEHLVGSICQTIRAGFGTRVPTIEAVAEMSGGSTSTLQRRLRSDGVTYSDLVDRVRFDEARTLLTGSDMALTEIAHRLGYSDAANFTHAFQRWTGSPPSKFRRGNAHSG